jgi:hypothetical protein
VWGSRPGQFSLHGTLRHRGLFSFMEQVFPNAGSLATRVNWAGVGHTSPAIFLCGTVRWSPFRPPVTRRQCQASE